ncbi:alpha/beta fold hydrolase [Deinococcus sp. AJ005]|uniref:alpha/beta fold hydrolase n=1 Tax=Deinococcus sp. AJ005 TaxID=2652443 RepID=UPI00125CB68D|nr:alpha/beta fold hydrolase [Deinococcus sp. AJ005]QFP76293.1 alpha/beta hydrolase [Deinococcus sp. AJ005]
MTRLTSRGRTRLALPPRVRFWLGVILALVLGYLIALGQSAVVRPPLVIGQDAVPPSGQAVGVTSTLENEGGAFINIKPSGEAKTLLVYYPGGLVRPQAYEWLGRALAADGVQTVIPVFPLDLAVTGINRADALIKKFGAGKTVVIAGHSLGGAMAAQYAKGHTDQLKGMILMGAYPAGNVSLKDTSLPVLSLLAENDRVADPANVRDGLNRLPASAKLTVIPGSVHSFFGRYGPQKGDGLPTVTHAAAEAEILTAIKAFIATLPTP